MGLQGPRFLKQCNQNYSSRGYHITSALEMPMRQTKDVPRVFPKYAKRQGCPQPNKKWTENNQ